MKYALIEVPDDFEKGQCHDCPLYEDDCCVLHCRYDECPLEIKEEYKGEDKEYSDCIDAFKEYALGRRER
jgi:hypothetical protein